MFLHRLLFLNCNWTAVGLFSLLPKQEHTCPLTTPRRGIPAPCLLNSSHALLYLNLILYRLTQFYFYSGKRQNWSRTLFVTECVSIVWSLRDNSVFGTRRCVTDSCGSVREWNSSQGSAERSYLTENSVQQPFPVITVL
jgi:hypothetical protein